jgi:predicted amidohydrolase YtcJ
VFFNAKVYTINEAFPTAEAFVVSDGKFIDVGSNKDILSRHPNAQVLSTPPSFRSPILDSS